MLNKIDDCIYDLEQKGEYRVTIQDSILTVSQFAKKIKTSRMKVLRMISSGKILAFRISDCKKSHWRIKESEIDRLISFELHNRTRE